MSPRGIFPLGVVCRGLRSQPRNPDPLCAETLLPRNAPRPCSPRSCPASSGHCGPGGTSHRAEREFAAWASKVHRKHFPGHRSARGKAETPTPCCTDRLKAAWTNPSVSSTDPASNRTCEDSRLIQDLIQDIASKRKKKEKEKWTLNPCAFTGLWFVPPFDQAECVYLKWHCILSIITCRMQLFCCYSLCFTPLFWVFLAPTGHAPSPQIHFPSSQLWAAFPWRLVFTLWIGCRGYLG